MITEQWHVALLVGLFAANILFTYQLYRMRRGRPRRSDADSGAVDREAGVAVCPTCGAENDLEYRYCRSCVGALPGTGGVRRAAKSPLRRMTR